MLRLFMDRRQTRSLAKALQEENARAIRELRIPGHKKPHYLSHLARHREQWILEARYGALTEDSHDRRRNALCDVRVGSFRRDQVRSGGLMDNSSDLESHELVHLPTWGSRHGLDHALWRLTEAKYREACDDMLHRRAVELSYLDVNRRLGAFERRDPRAEFVWKEAPEFDHARWKKVVLDVSAAYKRYPLLRDGHVRFRATNLTRVFVSSEGDEIAETSTERSVELYFWFLAPDGYSMPYTKTFFVTDESELPDAKTLKKYVAKIYARLVKLSKAPLLRSYAGPVLLDPRPAGLLVHEAIGHRLEGNRLLSEGEGQTFRDAVGSVILLDGIDIWDDPRMTHHEGKSLCGHYLNDDEGAAATRADLVSGGVLQGFLTSRSPIAKGHRSNGHARSAKHERAISRMGVTVMQAREGLSDAAMRQAFVQEIRSQGVPFGIRILEASGGETTTEAYDFQAFLGQVDLASRVFPDGREEFVRGVDLVGTPLNAVRGIIAAGARQEVDNSWCGAESGYVPVTTISPTLLVDELELQAKPMRSMTPFAYPMPWETR